MNCIQTLYIKTGDRGGKDPKTSIERVAVNQHRSHPALGSGGSV